jgi:hypothetical protein
MAAKGAVVVQYTKLLSGHYSVWFANDWNGVHFSPTVSKDVLKELLGGSDPGDGWKKGGWTKALDYTAYQHSKTPELLHGTFVDLMNDEGCMVCRPPDYC